MAWNPNSIGRPFLKGEEHPNWKGGITLNRTEYQRNYARKWRKEHPENRKRECLNARKWQKNNPIRNAINEYKKRARNKGMEYNISDKLFEILVTSNCHYCGISPNPINGLDRVNSSKGYVEDNVVTACSVCNYAKNNKSIKEFEDWAIRLAQNINRRRKNNHECI